MTSVIVSDEFVEKRALLVIDRPIFDCHPGGDYVHSIDLWNFMRLEIVCRVTNG